MSMVLSTISFIASICDMTNMFLKANNFNRDLNWNVANVTSMNNMFMGAESFNKNIGQWNVANVKYMNSMFENAHSFNIDLSEWQLDNLLEQNNMFRFAVSFESNVPNKLTVSIDATQNVVISEVNGELDDLQEEWDYVNN